MNFTFHLQRMIVDAAPSQPWRESLGLWARAFPLYVFKPKPLLCIFIFRFSNYVLCIPFQPFRVQFLSSFHKCCLLMGRNHVLCITNSSRQFGPILPSVSMFWHTDPSYYVYPQDILSFMHSLHVLFGNLREIFFCILTRFVYSMLKVKVLTCSCT
jgi:hypothetical protein